MNENSDSSSYLSSLAPDILINIIRLLNIDQVANLIGSEPSLMQKLTREQSLIPYLFKKTYPWVVVINMPLAQNNQFWLDAHKKYRPLFLDSIKDKTIKPLFQAILENNTEEVIEIINQQDITPDDLFNWTKPVSTPDFFSRNTKLALVASANKNQEILDALYHKSVQYLSRQKDIHLGIAFNQKNVIDAWIKDRIDDSEVTTNTGKTPFWQACQNGHLELVKKLMATGNIDVDKADNDGTTPFWTACENGHLELVKKLMATGNIDVDKADNDGTTPFWIACQNGHSEVVKELIATEKVDVDRSDNAGITPFWIACQIGHLEVVKELMATGKVDIDKADSDGTTPFWIACQNGHLEVVKELMATGKVNVDKADNDGTTPFWIACQNGHLEVVKELMATGKVNVDKADNDGTTPFWIACQNGHLEVVKELIATGMVDVNKDDNPLSITECPQINRYINAVLKHPEAKGNTYTLAHQMLLDYTQPNRGEGFTPTFFTVSQEQRDNNDPSLVVELLKSPKFKNKTLVKDKQGLTEIYIVLKQLASERKIPLTQESMKHTDALFTIIKLTPDIDFFSLDVPVKHEVKEEGHDLMPRSNY
jgi:ankyrin repeat protein